MRYPNSIGCSSCLPHNRNASGRSTILQNSLAARRQQANHHGQLSRQTLHKNGIWCDLVTFCISSSVITPLRQIRQRIIERNGEEYVRRQHSISMFNGRRGPRQDENG
ncbi:unnamed protein product [Meloidogyne enterolobii]|uniref:Uncharacterized protein n=1 Tax=Meloidogyne enterolobii TaxID=390850 RepID=A0ACB0XXX7_MELEN